MKWNYNGTTGLANNDNEIFFLFFVYFFFLRIRRKNLKSNSVPVGVLIVLESEGLYSVPRNTGKKKKKKKQKNFAPVC